MKVVYLVVAAADGNTYQSRVTFDGETLTGSSAQAGTLMFSAKSAK
ncbi:MAG: hypothetical protein LBM59_05340 [Ruminococcus sp.]|nr:hypothetical protein [Ruminococcus sp.]